MSKPDHNESIYTSSGIGLTSNIEIIKSLKELVNYKFAIGYCGWDAGQLDYEISLNSWLVLDVDPKIIFDFPPNKIVDKVSRLAGFDINQVQNTETVTKH